MTTAFVDDPAAELDPTYADSFEQAYSAPVGADPDADPDVDVSRETSEINTEPTPRKRPGPAPNPNSARSRRRAAKATKAAAPRKRASPNTSATATAAEPEPDTVYERGAIAVLGWVTRPLAFAGLGMGLAASQMPTKADGTATPRAARIGEHAQALSLDALTLIVHGPALAKGVAPMAEQIPWMAAVLEKAAAISPVAALVEAGAGIMMQMLANHGIVPVTPILGTLGPSELRLLAGIPDPEPAAG